MDTHHFKSFIETLSRDSARAILPHFGNHQLEVDAKDDDSPVTAADRESETCMRKKINQTFPDHGILGEEYGNEKIDAEYVWILDPIDGTKSFISGVPLFTTLIGLLHYGKPILGAIHQPVLGKLCIGDGKQCWLNGDLVSMRQRPLSASTLLMSEPYAIEHHQDEHGWRQLVEKTMLHRSWGDGYGYMLVATGWADIMCDPVLEPWDLLPVIPVVEGAGARVTDWWGNAIRCDTEGRCARSAICAHPNLHEKIVGILNKESS